MIRFSKFLKVSLILLFFGSERSSGQTNVYHPFPDSNAHWNIEYFDNFSFSTLEYFSIHLNGDTLINNLTYRKLNIPFVIPANSPCPFENNPGYAGSIRQDTVLRTVYFIADGDSVETLLYDFNLKIGDTITQCSGSAEPYLVKVYGIDSVYVGGSFRKKYLLYGFLPGNFYWIEGIGSELGLLWPCRPIDPPISELKCFRQDNTIQYPDTGTCDLITKIVFKSTREFFMHPNPSTGIFYFRFQNKEAFQQIEVFNYLGKRILQKHGQYNEINLSAFASGIYFYSITKKSGRTFQGKIVKD